MKTQILSNTNINALVAEVNSVVSDSVNSIIVENSIEDEIKSNIAKSVARSTALRHEIGKANIVDPTLSEEDYSKEIKDLDKDLRAKLWEYRNVSIRIALLRSIFNSKKRFNKRLAKSFQEMIRVFIENGNKITLSQLAHRLVRVLAITHITLKTGEDIEADTWIQDEVTLQFINELAELDYLDLYIEDKIHMVKLGSKSLDNIDLNALEEASRKVWFINMNKPSLDPIPLRNKNLISISSWWYKTPEQSADLIEFQEIMNNLKFTFKDNAEKDIEKLYLTHLDPKGELKELPKWAKDRVKVYRQIIRESTTNRGHYISGRFDSSLRWYFNADIGHFQTSAALRSIVEIDGIKDPIKYDMTNNVVQMYAVLTGIKSLAKYVGLTETKVGDLRALIAEDLNNELSVDVFNKDNIKPLFMVWAYNAGKDRLLDGVFTEEKDFFGNTVKQLKVEGLRSLINDPSISDDTIWSAWSRIVNRRVPAIVAIKATFNKLNKVSPFTETQWTLPDGGIAQYASTETVSDSLKWISSSNRKHQHTHYRKELSVGSKAAGLLPRVIHSFDAYMMRQLVIRANREGIVLVPNHDSFIMDRSNVGRFNELVKELFIELLESNHLSKVINELNHSKASLAIKDSEGNYITSEMFGEQLTAEDILAGEPTEEEEI